MPVLPNPPRSALLSGLLLLGSAGCGRSPGAAAGDARAVVTVFAAASMADVVTRLAEGFATARVRTSFGPSSGLARQILDAAPADVFLSASRRWMEVLEEAGALADAPRELARGRLVWVAAADSGLAVAAPADLDALRGALAAGDRVAIADPGVPAGEYARQSLQATGDLGWLQPHLVGQEDVRTVLRAVATGQVAAGLVYATDARAADVRVLFSLDPATHDPVAWYAAVTRTAPSPDAARAFLDHLGSEAGREVLRSAGFEVPP